MKKKSSTTTVIRYDQSKGNFATIPTHILRNSKLTDSALRLLQLLVNNAPDWSICLEYYRRLLGWSKCKQASAVKNLSDNGYIKRDRRPNGKGFSYYYVVSEFGNLSNETGNVTNGGSQPEIEELPINDDKVHHQLRLPLAATDTPDTGGGEHIQTQSGPETPPQLPTSDSSEELTNLVLDELVNIFDEMGVDEESTHCIVDNYLSQIDCRQITSENLDLATLRDQVTQKIEAQRPHVNQKWLLEYIELKNSGTAAQLKQNKESLILWVRQKEKTGEAPTEQEIKNRFLLIKTNNTKNRVLDSRYND